MTNIFDRAFRPRIRAATMMALLAVTAAFAGGCKSDEPTSGGTKPTPFTITVSEVPTATGGQQAHFEWTGAVYRMAVSRRNPNGTSTIMWSWEVITPQHAVVDGITYGATPPFADCSIHKCQASGLTRGVEYTVTVYRGLEEMAERAFTL